MRCSLEAAACGTKASLPFHNREDILPDDQGNIAFVLEAADTVCGAESLEASTHCLETGMPCSELAAHMLAPAVCTTPFKRRNTSSFVAQLILHGMIAFISSWPASDRVETQCKLRGMQKAVAYCSKEKHHAESVPVPQ